MLFCWVAWGYRIENGGLFAGMNAVIHSIMSARFPALCSYL